ncbi:uncharacterized protein J3R85_001833 [Psidium guajava]|nr:uncharacterized protein J3R85_001833 [Psidium guajava]
MSGSGSRFYLDYGTSTGSNRREVHFWNLEHIGEEILSRPGASRRKEDGLDP